MLDGYQLGDPVVRVFASQADPGRSAEEIADEAFDIFTGHPRDAAGADLACAYDGRRLRSLSFPGKRSCFPKSCCIRHSIVLPGCRKRGQSEAGGTEAPTVSCAGEKVRR